jgi:hypothetical protein
MIALIAVSAVLMVKPNYKCAKGKTLAVKTAGSEASLQESSFVDCYLEASVPPLLGLSLALNWAAMTRHTYAGCCFMTHYDFFGPSKLPNISPLPRL